MSAQTYRVVVVSTGLELQPGERDLRRMMNGRVLVTVNALE